ncbi:MAG: class I SAM-dependent methyltransferase [Candidatus Odinarchaeota archaeon]|nr:class I SAM-dependent methyltransferase [Candidatus Odinarchaeota archaeon]
MLDEIDEIVKSWYREKAQYEWERLQQDPYHQLEFIITFHFLKKYLPKTGLVLDAGGGPGRYTIELAKRGYDVILLDLVPELLKIAKEQIKKAGVQNKVKQIVEGSIDDLSMFENETFDAVLCLGGVLNHLLDERRREKAARELIRVAKKGAPIFVSVISRLGVLRAIFLRFPESLKFCKHHWEVGDYIPGVHGRGFTAAHWFLPEELKELFERLGVKILEMAALEGLSSHHREETNKLYENQENWKLWLEILLETCNHPSIIGASEHFLMVAKKI